MTRRRGSESQRASAAIAPATYFEPQPGLGITRINLFIAECNVGEPFGTSNGNCRGFSSAAGCAESKVCVTVNFEQGWVSGQISPTCKGTSCTDAYPVGGGNTFDVHIDDTAGDPVVTILVDALNSRAMRVPHCGAPAIDARLRVGVETVTRPGNPSLHMESATDRVFFVEACGDAYPSLEAYVTRDGTTGTAIRAQKEQSFRRLDPGRSGRSGRTDTFALRLPSEP